jgi:hypothetical protein
MSCFNLINTDLNIIILQYLDQKNFMDTRAVSKQFLETSKADIFWRIINLTDVNTVDEKILCEQFKDNNQLQIYNLSQKFYTTFSIPHGLLQYLSKTKLLII